MTSQDEITRTADRLKDAFGAAADVMAVGGSPVRSTAADVITSGDSLVRIPGPRIGHAWKWLLPLTAAVGVAVIVLAQVFVGQPATNIPARNTPAGGPFAQLFSGTAKADLANVLAPDPAVLNNPGAKAAGGSAVKILGYAPKCGLLIEGSGFVYAPQHVITAAHVVAGVTREGLGSAVNGPVVTTAGGVTHRARVVFYDPRADIAVLDVPGLNLTPLRFAAQASNGSDAVVAGYPEDHSLTAVPARIGQTQTIQIPNIYHTSQAGQQVYQLKAAVEEGNSGSPLITPDGDVYGMVFATDTNAPDTGFALTAAEVAPDANAGANATVPVSTQGCTSG
jgi:S1-C subfamily serine protease